MSDENKVISISQESMIKTSSGEETQYDTIYRIKVHEITLRELLLFQSLYVSKTQSDIVALVKLQPNPSVFYKAFLELDCSNMCSLLNFDSRSMESLLHDDHSAYFSSEFPIFYKNKIPKPSNPKTYFYRSAIDSSLKNNQVGAVGLMIDYIVKYQNNYVSSYLFLKNIPTIMEKGIPISELFRSDIFVMKIDFDEWPATHTVQEKFLRPYSGTIYDLRNEYSNIFHEKKFQPIETDNEDQAEKIDTSKVYKISYFINLLPSIGAYIMDGPNGIEEFNEDVGFMGLLSEMEDELEIFDTASIHQLI